MNNAPDRFPADRPVLHLTDEVAAVLSQPDELPPPSRAVVLDPATMRAILLSVNDGWEAVHHAHTSELSGPILNISPNAVRARNRLSDLLPADFRRQHAEDLEAHMFSTAFERALHAAMAHTDQTNVLLALYWSIQASLRSDRTAATEAGNLAFDMADAKYAPQAAASAHRAMNGELQWMGERAARVLAARRLAETRSGVYLVWMDDEHQVSTGMLADLGAWCQSNDREGGDRGLVEVRAPYDGRTMLKLDWRLGGVGGYDACDIGTACITVTLPYGTERTAYWAVDGRS